jgi:hypothetical protein
LGCIGVIDYLDEILRIYSISNFAEEKRGGFRKSSNYPFEFGSPIIFKNIIWNIIQIIYNPLTTKTKKHLQKIF